MIDRFDVRAHLDYISEVKNPDIPPEDLSQEERQCNYERYRILAQNAFLGISMWYNISHKIKSFQYNYLRLIKCVGLSYINFTEHLC